MSERRVLESPLNLDAILVANRRVDRDLVEELERTIEALKGAGVQVGREYRVEHPFGGPGRPGAPQRSLSSNSWLVAAARQAGRG